ncbi:MAG: alpha-1,2-fucosyltransferase [Lachnospiraceae bacterium]|nr:alpha-1,2-fucosyltransferase [Lachnospiraceae bacterium]
MLKDQETAKKIYEIAETAVAAAYEMLDIIRAGNTTGYLEYCAALKTMLKADAGIYASLKKEEEGLNTPEVTESVLWTLTRIEESVRRGNINFAVTKTEFELIPLLEEFRVNFYFWGLCKGDPEREEKYYKEDIKRLATNKYTVEAEKTGKYKYDMSICVVGYNELEYTRECVESLMKNLPKEASYELIFINHGSNDGTKEFFEQFNPDKQLDIKVNGGGFTGFYRITEGKYTLLISNDVMVMKNSLDNLYKCAIADKKAVYCVPMTTNISNYQSPRVNLSCIEAVKEYAEECNKVSDPLKWERRTRLCNPIDIIKSSFIEETKMAWLYQSRSFFSFPDDKISLLARRGGYHMYLVKDAFCYHHGSATISKEKAISDQKFYDQGRKDFKALFGVDPWYRPNFFPYLMDVLKPSKKGHVDILSVESAAGAQGLKIKEALKENAGNTDVFFKYKCFNPAYAEDIKDVADRAEIISSESEIYEDKKYDYILVEDINGSVEATKQIIQNLFNMLKEGGRLIMGFSGTLAIDMRNPLNEIDNIECEKCVEDKESSENKTFYIYKRPDGKAKKGLRIVRLNGGLGNQLYQYAFGRAIEIKTDERVIFDDSFFFLKEAEGRHNGYELEKIFGVKPKLLSNEYSKEEWAEIIKKADEGKSIPDILKESGKDILMMVELDDMEFKGNKVYLPVGSTSAVILDVWAKAVGNIYYNGYWVTPKPYEFARKYLFRELKFKPLIKTEGVPIFVLELEKRIRSCDSVAVHIRRGDFIKAGRALSPEKYAMAIRKMEELHPGGNYFVFSDDIEWCKENFLNLGFSEIMGRLVFVEGTCGNGWNYLDMQLMSMCNRIIFSNSSFGNWAFFLNEIPKSVIGIYADTYIALINRPSDPNRPFELSIKEINL